MGTLAGLTMIIATPTNPTPHPIPPLAPLAPLAPRPTPTTHPNSPHPTPPTKPLAPLARNFLNSLARSFLNSRLNSQRLFRRGGLLSTENSPMIRIKNMFVRCVLTCVHIKCSNMCSKPLQKVTWKAAGTKNTCFDPRSPKSYHNVVPKSKQNRKKTKPGPQDLFSNAPRYPQGAKWKHQAYQMIGFGHQKRPNHNCISLPCFLLPPWRIKTQLYFITCSLLPQRSTKLIKSPGLSHENCAH
jgi:hypothetical protein